jgi:glyoxylate carboligase
MLISNASEQHVIFMHREVSSSIYLCFCMTNAVTAAMCVGYASSRGTATLKTTFSGVTDACKALSMGNQALAAATISYLHHR